MRWYGITCCIFLLACEETTVPTHVVDAGATADTNEWERSMRPGLQCLKREEEASRERIHRLQEKEAELNVQIDVMSGAYALRRQLELEPEEKAIKHALAVLKWDAVDEQSKVARKFLRDKDAIYNSPFDPTNDERIEHEMIRMGLLGGDAGDAGK